MPYNNHNGRFPGGSRPSVDLIWAARNWYLHRYLKKPAEGGGAKGKPQPVVIDRETAIGISQATRQLIKQLPDDKVPTKPPSLDASKAPNLALALYPYTRDVQLANQGIGYGEGYVDVLWERRKGEHKLARVERFSRRTKSGRQEIPQPDEPATNPSASSPPEPLPPDEPQEMERPQIAKKPLPASAADDAAAPQAPKKKQRRNHSQAE